MALVKICGLSTVDTLDAAIAAGATHIGFMFYPRSLRYVTPEVAAALAARVPQGVAKVGVLVDADDALIAEVAPFLDALQLQGNETPARVADVRARTARETWRAVGVATRADVEAAVAHARGVADLLLFDAKAPSGTAPSGGTGVRFDWRLLDGVRPNMAWGLAGGLDSGNVGAALALTHAPLADVSSGVEDAPGQKSVDKIRAFIAAARAA
jgi:phosphoribosylanthranilate isomerase